MRLLGACMLSAATNSMRSSSNNRTSIICPLPRTHSLHPSLRDPVDPPPCPQAVMEVDQEKVRLEAEAEELAEAEMTPEVEARLVSKMWSSRQSNRTGSSSSSSRGTLCHSMRQCTCTCILIRVLKSRSKACKQLCMASVLSQACCCHWHNCYVMLYIDNHPVCCVLACVPVCLPG